MKTPQRVVWSEGLLMSPHHLQQLDNYHEALLGSRIEAVEPLNWGVLRVELDRRALGTGQVRVTEFVGVLPDGMVLSAEGDHAELPPSRPVEGHFPPTQKNCEIYLGVPRERDGAVNYSESGASRSRFLIDKREVHDLTTTGQTATIGFGKRNVSILFGDESRADFETIKIAEIVRDDSGGLVLSDPYVPPCLRISASSFLVAGIRRLLNLSVTRQRSLSDARRQRDASTIEFNASDVTRFLLLNAINTYLPVMNYLVDAADLSPRATYLSLCQYAGQLATFSATEDPTTLPKFVYTNLRGTFEELFARITALLQSTVKEHYLSLPLDTRDDGVHFGRIEDDQLLRASAYLITVESEIAEQEVATSLPRLSKIASWGDINGILSAATPGVPAEVTYRPPPEIPIRAGRVYFTLSVNNNYWRNIIADRTVAVYLPRPFDPTKTTVTLLAVPQASKGRS